MKIKQISIFFSIILCFLLLPSVLFSLSNLAFWPWNNYIFSNHFNRYLEKVFPKSDMLKLKKWDFYYRMGEYQKALSEYLKLNCNTDKKCFTLYHNIGNTYYKLWEYTHNTMEKISFWQQSLVYYQRALDITYDEETKKNYDFVLQKLRKLMDDLKEENELEPESEENHQPSQETEEQNQNTQESETEEQPEQNQNSQEIQPRGPSIKIDEFSQQAQQWLSDDEKNMIEEYLHQLQEEERQNRELNKPREQRDILDILREDFFFDKFDRNESGW